MPMYHFWEPVIRPIFEIVRPRSIVEIGADEGQHTRRLLEYCKVHGATMHVVDVFPLPALPLWQEEFGDHLVLHTEKSLDALPKIPDYDAVLIDGDHSWYTVFHELLLMEEHALRTGEFPLVFLHDVGWPLARRDAYYAPEQIPPEFRHPYDRRNPLFGRDTLASAEGGGCSPHVCFATQEGGPRNGVLTAVEDFLDRTKQDLRFVNIPGFHGLGVLAPESLCRASPAFAALWDSLKSNPLLPLLEHLENDRVEIGGARARECHTSQNLSYELNRARRTAEVFLRKSANVEDPLSALKELRDRERELQRMQKSKSWRWTAPLRKLEKRLRESSLKRLRWSRRSVRLRLSKDQKHALLSKAAVIILSRNQGKSLREALRSILGQTVPPGEILVLDWESHDETLAVASQYKNKGVLYVRGKWDDASAAWNTGIQSTGAPYLLCMDATDLLSTRYIGACLMALEERAEMAIAYGDILTRETPLTFTRTSWEEGMHRDKNPLGPRCAMLRRYAVEEVGGFRARGETFPHWDLFERILAKGAWRATHVETHSVHDALAQTEELRESLTRTADAGDTTGKANGPLSSRMMRPLSMNTMRSHTLVSGRKE